MDKDTQEKIQTLQGLEQSFQSLMMQKHHFEIEINEINTALEEISKSSESVYKLIGKIMLKADNKQLEKELNEKKNLLNIRMNSIKKQETGLREDIERIRNEVINKVK
jgi:prefoldin beta subunit